MEIVEQLIVAVCVSALASTTIRNRTGSWLQSARMIEHSGCSACAQVADLGMRPTLHRSPVRAVADIDLQMMTRMLMKTIKKKIQIKMILEDPRLHWDLLEVALRSMMQQLTQS